MKPTELNNNANISNASEVNYIPSFDDLELQPYAADQLKTTNVQLLPVATIATRNNRRIDAHGVQSRSRAPWLDVPQTRLNQSTATASSGLFIVTRFPPRGRV
jgi:hypothetical protein